MTRATRRRRPVTGSRPTSTSTRQTPSRTGWTPPEPRFRRFCAEREGFEVDPALELVDRLSRPPGSSTTVRVRQPVSDLGFPGADDGIRTRDPNLGKVVLYQLSHVRVPTLTC